jgi:flagellar biosynthesis protein FlhF
MKMKLFSAATLDEAMALVRAEMGPDAVILSTRDEDGTVEVRAAVERSFNPRFAAPRFAEPRPVLESARDELSAALHWNAAPEAFSHLVAQAGARLGAGTESLGALAAGLESVLAFAPLSTSLDRSVMLVGTAGSGKTTLTAKLALALRDRKTAPEPVAADFDASGQSARLAGLLLRPTVGAAYSPDSLFSLVRSRHGENRRLIIDTPPFNPLDEADMGRLKDLVDHSGAEPILVMPAGGDALELEDNARAFANIGVRRAIISKIDLVRRKAGALAALSAARLSIAHLGFSPHANGGLSPASAAGIARLLLENAPETNVLKGAA